MVQLLGRIMGSNEISWKTCIYAKPVTVVLLQGIYRGRKSALCTKTHSQRDVSRQAVCNGVKNRKQPKYISLKNKF